MTTGALDKPKIHLCRAELEHGRSVYEVICKANDFNPLETIPGVFGKAEWQTLLTKFAPGQFVALADVNGAQQVVGVAISMRTSYLPSEPPKSWRDMIGDLSLSQHDPNGRWLYGVEKAVHPNFQGMGIGSALYRAQFELVDSFSLDGMYAGGMLKGYKNYKDVMSIRSYGAKVVSGEIFDPTVSIQLRKGFKALSLIENYVWDHEAQHTGMLIVYEREQAHASVKEPSSGSHLLL